LKRVRRALARYLPPQVKTLIRRVIGRRPAAAPDGAPAVRAFDIRMPVGPGGVRPGAPATLRIEAPSGLFVPRVLESSGLAGYEPNAAASFLAAIDLVDARAVFDVGANIGVFALLASASTAASVTAFEPTPDIATAFRAIVDANRLRCQVETIALGASDGTATLHLSASTDSSNSLLAGFRAEVGTLEVPLERLDSYCVRTGVWPTVLKVDTEATEPDVFRGATRLLGETRPWIICEVLAGRTESALMEVLGPFGYHWYQITDSMPFPSSETIVGDPTYRELDWLFAPIPPPDRFWTRALAWREALAACLPAPRTRRPR
jgi:FkbM family methyltransferase